MLLQAQEVRYINSVTHAGKVVLFGTDSNGKVWYTIKQDGFEDSYLNTPPNERTGWEEWQELELPNEAEDDASVVEKETKEYTYQDNPSQFILRSRYRTQDQSAVAPVQLVSGMEHLYVFRQSKQNTLLCDRYVLDGIANKLVRKLQVRFKRSGQRFKPSEDMQQTARGLKNVDSLDYRDANGKAFYEPTTELAFVNNLHQGWFSVIQLPTVEHAKYRWNIFAYDSQSQKVNLYSVRVSEEGLFEVHDYSIFEPKSENDPTLIPRSIPGIIKRTLDLNVALGNGISATKFYVQSSQETEAGTQLMRDATKVMLALVTSDDQVATINFTALGDGTLSQIGDTPSTEILRSNIREVLLPLNTLDNIKSIGIADPPPEGKIAALNQTITDGIPHVRVTSPEASILKNGQEIIIQNTNHYNGHYTITKIDETTFEIDAPWVENGSTSSELGIWQVVPPAEQAVVFDGIITGYEITAEGKLRVTAENHGLEHGDEVQIFDTASYDGTYPITKVDDQNFIINDLRWQTGEAVNLKLQSQKRRGIVFDGAGDYVQLPPESMPIGNEITVSFWAKGGAKLPQNTALIYANGANNERVFSIHLPWSNGTIFFDSGDRASGFDRIEKAAQPAEYKDQWVHWAFTKNATTGEMKIFCNGKLWHSGTGKKQPLVKTQTLTLGGFFNQTNFYHGTVSELRIWKVARTEKEIKNSMYLRLTGKELDLVGYWRLGGIAVDEDNQRKVIDFSVNQNDGTAYGDCYVSAVTLNRKLGDGVTDAVQYTNGQLFAVTQNATYEETFEVKASILNPTPTFIDPNNVNGSGQKLFNCTYWGQKTHRSKDQISFPGDVTEFKPASEQGWYIASCRFTVPSEVNLVRCFEISDVVGTWDTLEIRKQRIRKISDVITEATYTDAVTLSSLGSNQGEAFSQLKQLQQKELEEQTFLKKKVELDAQLAALNAAPDKQTAINNKQTEINNQKALITNLQGEVNSLYSAYQNELNNPLNYWCKITALAQEMNAENECIRIDTNSAIKYLITDRNGFKGYPYQYFKFEKVGDYYKIICLQDNLIITLPKNEEWNLRGSNNVSADTNQQWRIEKTSEGYYKIQSRYNDKMMNFSGYDWWNVIQYPEHGTSPHEKWIIAKTSSARYQETNNNIANARLAWEAKKQELQAAQAKLAQLEQELVDLQNSSLDLAALKSQLTSEIAALTNQIQAIQLQINTANSQIMTTAQTKSEAQMMPAIATQGDVVTTGSILDFIRTTSRVTALETVEGMVQLSYFDEQGKLRQGIFDATADEVNSYFEQWLPDHPPICLNCDSGDKRISLSGEGIAIGGNWTIEANFVYPFPDTAQWNTLTKKASGDRHVVVKDGQYLGTDVNGTFYYCLLDTTLPNEVGNAYDMSHLAQGWHHLAAIGKTTVESSTATSKTIFYIDGQKVGEALVKSNSPIQHIGNIGSGGEPFGKISELRIWNLALKETEIITNSQVYLTGNEPGLVACYRLNEGSGTEARDYSGNGNDGTITGANWWGNTKVLPAPVSQVMSFDGSGDYINCGNSYNFANKSFTVEFWLKRTVIDNSQQQLIVSQGQMSTNRALFIGFRTTSKFFMAFYGNALDTDNAYTDTDWHHWACTFDHTTKRQVIYRDGVLIKERTADSNSLASGDLFIGCLIDKTQYLNGNLAEFRIWNTPRSQAQIQANITQRLTGGETGLELYLPFNNIFTEGTATKVFDLAKNRHGTVYNASLISATPKVVKNSNTPTTVMNFDGVNDYIQLPPESMPSGNAITVSFWAKGGTNLPQNTALLYAKGANNERVFSIHLPWSNGTIYFDSGNSGTSFDRINKAAQTTDYKETWVHWAFTKNASTGEMKIFRNGTLWHSGTGKTQLLPKTQTLTLGCFFDQTNFYNGAVAEFCIWNVARTQAEIQADMSKRLTGKEAGLQLYLPLDKIEAGKVIDLVNNRQCTVYSASVFNDSSLPISSAAFSLDALPLNQGTTTLGTDSLITSVEYNTYDVDPITKKKSAMMRRMFAHPTANGVQVITDKRIENLELIWIGNAQFAPTLLGYIEGAPPVPSENMNIDGDYQYNGATSVQLTTTEDVEYSWNRSQDAGLGAKMEFFTGAKSSSSAGLGFITEIESSKIGAAGDLDMSYQWFNESNVSSSSSLVTTDSLELRGAPEVTPKFPHYGNRFIPKNVGYALVVSGLADVFITRLSRTGKMVGHEVRPVEDIPPDVNTITFLMNPAYVMNGSLDGLVGSSAANEEFYGHVPEMRAQYGSLYPASYFRLMEAYNLKQQIEKADKERLSYFENFNSSRVDEASLAQQAGDGTVVEAVTLNEGAESIDASGEESTEEKNQAQLDQLQTEGNAKLGDLQKQGQKRKQDINSRIDDTQQRTHALESFAGWQKNMENILVRSGKRNIVNTYVWDADGGLRVEEQSFANTSEHTIGGSFSMSGSLGAKMNLSVFKVGVELNAMATTNLTQTMTKTQATSKGMELNVDLSGIEILGITDENDVPFQPGEKVDRFRLMSFYLENSTDNYLDFFKYVVDPEWLASNDEEARALRQVQSGRPNKTWRVLHRVTYVERPTLMGFGRDLRSLAEIASYAQARMAWLIPANATVLDEVKAVRNRVEYLEDENAKLQAKLDKIIDWINQQ